MRKYLYLQLKRVFKVFPFVLLITLVLMLVLGILAIGVINNDKEIK